MRKLKSDNKMKTYLIAIGFTIMWGYIGWSEWSFFGMVILGTIGFIYPYLLTEDLMIWIWKNYGGGMYLKRLNKKRIQEWGNFNDGR